MSNQPPNRLNSRPNSAFSASQGNMPRINGAGINNSNNNNSNNINNININNQTINNMPLLNAGSGSSIGSGSDLTMSRNLSRSTPNMPIISGIGMGSNASLDSEAGKMLRTTSTTPVSASAPTTASSTPSNANNVRLETIRQYYLKLTNDLRLVTQQLQAPDLTAAKRQILLDEQKKLNATLHDFTEKILKPISANRSMAASSGVTGEIQKGPTSQVQQSQSQPNLQLQQQQQLMQLQQQQQQMLQRQFSAKSPSQSTQPTTGIRPIQMQQQQQQQQLQLQAQKLQQQQAAAVAAGMFPSAATMMRPAVNISAGFPTGFNISAGTMNRPPTTTNANSATLVSPMNPPNASYSSQPSPSRSSTVRPTLPLKTQSTGTTNVMPSSSHQLTKTQQILQNRQAILLAAQQHLQIIQNQQNAFQMRLSSFTQDNYFSSLASTTSTTTSQKSGRSLSVSSSNSGPSGFTSSPFIKSLTSFPQSSQQSSMKRGIVVNDEEWKNRFGPSFRPPILAVPPGYLNQPVPSVIPSNQSSPKKPVLTTKKLAVLGYESGSTSLDSVNGKPQRSMHPLLFSRKRIADLAAEVHPDLQIDRETEKVADRFTDVLGRMTCSLARHRLTSKRTKTSDENTLTNSSSSTSLRKNSAVDSSDSHDNIEAKKLTYRDIQLAMDSLFAMTPAGNGSIELLRPPRKLTAATPSTMTNSLHPTANLPVHLTRLAQIKKHASATGAHFGLIETGLGESLSERSE